MRALRFAMHDCGKLWVASNALHRPHTFVLSGFIGIIETSLNFLRGSVCHENVLIRSFS